MSSELWELTGGHSCVPHSSPKDLCHGLLPTLHHKHISEGTSSGPHRDPVTSPKPPARDEHSRRVGVLPLLRCLPLGQKKTPWAINHRMPLANTHPKGHQETCLHPKFRRWDPRSKQQKGRLANFCDSACPRKVRPQQVFLTPPNSRSSSVAEEEPRNHPERIRSHL